MVLPWFIPVGNPYAKTSQSGPPLGGACEAAVSVDIDHVPILCALHRLVDVIGIGVIKVLPRSMCSFELEDQLPSIVPSVVLVFSYLDCLFLYIGLVLVIPWCVQA